MSDTATDANGRVKLTFGQIVWGISVLVVLVGQWIRFEVRLNTLEQTVSSQKSYSRSEVDLMLNESTRDREELRRRLERVEARLNR